MDGFTGSGILNALLMYPALQFSIAFFVACRRHPGNVRMILTKAARSTKRQSGNIFFALFGAVALVGVLGVGIMTFMKGPLATSVRITRQNTAETQMTIAAQVAVMAASNTANSGDCDSDGYVEPLEWRAAGALPAPVGGGLIPSSIGVSKKDPWGTEYGYCVWDYGSIGSCDDETGAGDNPAERIDGTATGTSYPVVAIVSAGQDKTFTTTCRDFATADVNSDGDLLDPTDMPLVSKAAETDDDVIFTYTYEEATGASGGLWSIKSGDPNTAVINKKIETSGMAEFQGGVLLPDSSLITCDPTTSGVMARNASGGINICNGATWDAVSGGGGGASTGFDTAATCAGPADAGNVRYDTVTQVPQFCDGSAWRAFTLASQTANLVFSPTNPATMDVDGQNNLNPSIANVCDGVVDTNYYCGTPVTFTLQNQGGLASSTLPAATLTGNYTSNFVIKTDGCSGQILDPQESCTIVVVPKASGNLVYTTNLTVIANNNPIAIMSGSALGFGCSPGRTGGGGIYAYCGLSNAQGAYDLIVTPGGCTGTTVNPTCAGGADTLTKMWGIAGVQLNQDQHDGGGKGGGSVFPNGTDGAQNTVDLVRYGTVSSQSIDAVNWCYNLEYGGYTDWFLPAHAELSSYIYPNRTAIGGFQWNYYWSTNSDSQYAQSYVLHMGNSGGGSVWRSNGYYIRCARRNGQTEPAVTSDVDPDPLPIAVTSVTTSSGGSVTSRTFTVRGILQSISVSMSGGTGMNIVKNGVSTGSTSISGVNWGDTLAFTADAPTTGGTSNSITITVGSDTYTWKVGYANGASGVAKVFVTATAYNVAMGGLSGADSICQSLATSAGYGGNWHAILSDTATSASSRIPFNWSSLERLDGTTVASSWNDLWDGTLTNAINITETGSTSSSRIISNTDQYGGIYSFIPYATNYDWTSGTYHAHHIGGTAGNSGTTWITGQDWDNIASFSIYCLGVNPGNDTTPSMPNTLGDFTYAIQVPTSTLTTSNSVTVAGLGGSVSATVTITGSSGSPGFEVSTDNGATWSPGTSGVTTVENGDKLRLFLTSAPTASTNYLMTVTVGNGNAVKWRVWTGDPTGTVTKRVFVSDSGYTGALGGVNGADVKCTSIASAAGLGGTWKAILSGITESDAAINRIGYNWTTLTLVDGTTTVTTAGNIWSTTTLSFSNGITKSQSGTTITAQPVWSNTRSTGFNYVAASSPYNCYDYTNGDYGNGGDHYGTNSGTGSSWIDTGVIGGQCNWGLRLYCIEQ